MLLCRNFPSVKFQEFWYQLPPSIPLYFQDNNAADVIRHRRFGRFHQAFASIRKAASEQIGKRFLGFSESSHGERSSQM